MCVYTVALRGPRKPWTLNRCTERETILDPVPDSGGEWKGRKETASMGGMDGWMELGLCKCMYTYPKGWVPTSRVGFQVLYFRVLKATAVFSLRDILNLALRVRG